MIEILLALLFWGTAIEPRLILDIEREVAELPALSGPWEGERIAVLADWQVGMWLDNPGMAERAVRRIVEERPVAVLIAGDFLTKPEKGTQEKIDRVIRLVRPLGEAGIATIAVLGNHDYGLSKPGEPESEHVTELLVIALEGAGVRVLRNQAVPLFHPYAGASGPAGLLGARALYVVGIGSYYAGKDDPVAALADVPFDAPRIVLMHHPQSFRKISAWSAPLAIAGHRHGGQFRIPLVGKSLLRLMGKPGDGWAPDDFGAPGNRLYINRGIGMSVVPIRLNAPPELTFFTLVSPSSEGRQ